MKTKNVTESKLYIERAIECLRENYGEYNEFTDEIALELAEQGYSYKFPYVQIQPADDNYTGEILKPSYTRKNNNESNNPVLDCFFYKNKAYFLVNQY